MANKKTTKRRLARILGILALFMICGLLFFFWRIHVPAPEVGSNLTPAAYERVQVGKDHYRVNNCWLKKNEFGVWEMYLEGAPYERGLIYGVLAKELMEKQEVDFIAQIQEMIPGKFFLNMIKYFVGWFNKDMYKYIPDENLTEIYGVAQSFSDKFDFVGPKYYRILNYHGAHDIGHALADLKVVGCTSFAVREGFSKDTTLLIGRNFDFYVGDRFAEEKLILFMKPDSGYSFASYSWAGFTGVVSGMNQKGITVTLNASKSDIPYSAKEPISLLAREILQYASTTQEAITIAQKRETFVSESLLIGSSEENKAIIIEKSPTKMDVYDSGDDYLVCSNHYQSLHFREDQVNEDNIANSDSKYRYDRMRQLLERKFPIDYQQAASILRDKEGRDDKFIGYGNSKALNQLIAHHGVIFKPGKGQIWISTQPYQLGEFVCYDLDSVFYKNGKDVVDLRAMMIPKDDFLTTPEYSAFEAFKKTRQRISRYVMLGKELTLSDTEIALFIKQNPESYLTYLALGDYFKKKENYVIAAKYYQKSLEHEVASLSEVDGIKKEIEACKKLTN
jgi:isopenicillin-N N-acyltransferase-like protein